MRTPSSSLFSQAWDEVEAAYRWWVDVGRPGVERFGLDVGPEGEYAWLDSPVNPVRASG
jgi:hypothetical protein